ncbi:MAG TPA: ATP-binding cassette domain-containing protein [Steroidobacteraceae bacterium]|nr:ATP-binding cassette domain-containing protein [Steroidobacteraceae bacterium]
MADRPFARLEIHLEGLALTRSGRRLLHDIHWQIRPGERWLVIGASGAGKTQLLKVVAGDVWPDAARTATRRYRLDGEWHEQPVDVRDEIAWLGPERQDRYERYGWNHSALAVVGTGLHRTDIPLDRLGSAERDRCLSLLRLTGSGRLARRPFLTLSYGERRLVLLARALAWNASVLLLDEVATGLDAVNRQRLYRVLAGGRFRDCTWICSAHRDEDVPPGADHLLWLVDGRVKYAGELTARRLQQALAAARGKPKSGRRPARPRVARVPRRPVFTLSHADVWIDEKRVLTGIDLTLRRGECWVIHGGNGAGKSTLLRTLYGDHAVASGGSIRRAGVVPGVPLDDFRARTGLIAPHLQTDYPRHHTVLDTVVSGLHASLGLNFPATAAERRRALAALNSVEMEGFAGRTLAEMSYGQVRRILFARALVTRPRVLLLDEPFTGLSSQLRAQLLAWVEDRIAAGVTVVMATHYRGEWPRHASHELVLRRGRVVYAGTIRR